MMKWILPLLSISLFHSTVSAYETQTHDELSESTVLNSILELEPDFLISLGLEFDAGIREEALPSYVPRNPNNPTPKAPRWEPNASILEIIRGGSVLEDDDIRAVNHFFDVQNNGKGSNLANTPLLLPVPVFVNGKVARPSPDWILELDSEGQRMDIEEQQYSYSDALDYFYEAVTAKDLSRPGIVFTEEGRKRQFASMFRSLGHVLHHIQDMTQPQHVRNDLHCGDPRCEGTPFHNPSHWERYTNLERVRGSENFPVDASSIGEINFARVREFWDNLQGSGLANFTALNFISQGSNFKLENGIQVDPRYPAPVPTGNSEIRSLAEVLTEDKFTTVEKRDEILQRLNCDGTAECNLEFYETIVTDNYAGGVQTPNAKASSLSIFDKELTERNAAPSVAVLTSENRQATLRPERLFTFNRFNFAAAYDFLIPRAVAYGAGLINHFFRGRLQIEDVVVTANQMEITVKNVSKNNQALESGTFELYYDDINELRQEIAVTTPEGILPLAVDASVTLTATFPADLNTNKEKPFMLVFNAKATGNAIGAERGIAAINFTSEKAITGFLIHPYYDPSDNLPVPRLLTFKNGAWEAVPFEDGEAGNLDWKGQYVNGKATKVLTWHGEVSRYFPENNVDRSNFIYQGGIAYARMPCLVLGAAIRKNQENKEKIVGICASASNIRVLERPNTVNLSAAMFDPDTAPEGWTELTQFSAELVGEHSDWFFNGAGTEAQSILRIENNVSSPFNLILQRTRIEIVGERATMSIVESDMPVDHVVNSCTETCIDKEDGNDCDAQTHSFERTRSEFIARDGEYTVAVDYDVNGNEIIGVITNDFRRVGTGSVNFTSGSGQTNTRTYSSDASDLSFQ